MNETEFHRLADSKLTTIVDALEAQDQAGHLTVEYENGALSVELADGRQLLISKHAPTRQLWLSSPLLGGLHFGYDADTWALPDGRTLDAVLAQDLQALAAVKVAL